MFSSGKRRDGHNIHTMSSFWFRTSSTTTSAMRTVDILSCFILSLFASDGLTILPPIGRLSYAKSNAVREFFDRQAKLKKIQDGTTELDSRRKLSKDESSARAWTQNMNRTRSCIVTFDFVDDRLRRKRPMGVTVEFYKDKIEIFEQFISFAEYCHLENCTDFQLREILYEGMIYDSIQKKAERARKVWLPLMNYYLDVACYEEKLLSGRKDLESRPRYTRRIRSLERAANICKKSVESKDLGANEKTPFTKFETTDFKPDFLSSEPIVDEYEQLIKEHTSLILEIGPEYGELDPLEKLVFLEEINDIEDRWNIFFHRAKLMGALNPDRQKEIEVYLKSTGLSEDEYKLVHKLSLQRIRDEATKELMAQHDNERIDPSQILAKLSSSSPSSFAISQHKQFAWRPLLSLPQRLFRLWRIPF
jgi:hypothetical protein